MRGKGLLAAALVLALIPWGADASLHVERGSGDMVVNTDMTVQNDSIQPANNLWVLGATLTLIDCFIVMNPNTEIWVTGSLVMRNVVVTCTDNGPLYVFHCDGRVDMDNCTVSNSQSWHLDNSSHDCSITNCTFEMSGAGIEIYNGMPLLKGNQFIAGDYMFYYTSMVSIRDSAPVVEFNKFDGDAQRYDGLQVDYPASPQVDNNTFLDCSIGLMYYYIHQHADDGTVSPPAGEPAQFNDNRFTNCRQGLVTSDSPSGNGQGRAGGESRPGGSIPPVFLARRNIFSGNSEGLYANGEAPSVVERCELTGNGDGIRMDYCGGMLLENDTFTNNSFGVKAWLAELELTGCLFSTNDRNLQCDNTASKIEGNTFYGGENTTATLYSYSYITYYFANNTVISPHSIGIRLEGTGVIFNNTFKECPFGIYRAVRQYGQGHGRDIGQGPPAVQEMAIITQNRFVNNTRGIYSEGYSNISDNEFTGNWAGVEVSRFIHPTETGSSYWDTGSPVDRLTVERNAFSNNTAGVILLCTNYYGDDTGQRVVRDNTFAQNTIGIDMVWSFATCTGNNFSENDGWGFRQVSVESDVSGNDFGGCNRLWHQRLLSFSVYEPPENDIDAPLGDYPLSDNASVRITGRSGGVIHSSNTQNGHPPFFSPDGFPFYYMNLTTRMELGNGSIVNTNPVLAEAWKPGKGVANMTVDLDTQNYVDLYLEPTPDIVVRDFTFSKAAAIAGEHIKGNFTVLDDNTYDPSNVSLQDVQVDVALDGNIVETFNIPWLQSGVPETRDIEWTATPGNHTWTVTADPLSRYRDLRRDNNLATFRLEVNGRPEAVIEADRSAALTAEPFDFSGAGSLDDGAVVAFRFDFGDGSLSSWSDNATSTHTYARAGVYKARLKVRDDRGLESDWSQPWTVYVSNRPPSLAIVAAAADVLTGEPANFTISASDPEDSALTVSWDFGDGGRMSGQDLLSASHEYAGDGCYTVRVSVTDSDGGTASAGARITVRNRPPTAAFAVSPEQGTVITRFYFLPSDSDPDGQVLSYLWDFGDNSSSIMDRPFHSYGSPGVYMVSLTVKDDDGASSEPFKLGVVVRNTPPVARVQISGSQPRAGRTITFDASASFDLEDPSVFVRWDFGDGTVGTGPVAKHVYKRPGNYTVTVRVNDLLGASNETTLPVVVLGPEPTNGDDGWLTTVLGSGLLTIAGALFLVWVLRHRPERAPPPRPAAVRRVRRARDFDVYADRLARSRTEHARRENSNRSMYDAMQPVRDGGAGKPGNR